MGDRRINIDTHSVLHIGSIMAKGFKTGVRQKGMSNKVTGTVREMIRQSLSKELESLPELLGQLEAKERIDAIGKLIPYQQP